MILLLMPKKLTLREIYFSSGILGFGAWLGDALVGDVFKAFQIGPSHDTYLIDYIFISFVPLSIGLVYLNFLNKYQSVLYRWLWVVVAYLLEWGELHRGTW
ncbi:MULTISPECIES: hypothetical protein [Bacillaceae]|uniref:hypothetical protein n=1 Tax=Bacillaceae TaxID=186817 RepID=UPI001E584E40|nr:MULTISPECIES: hypothetical protein [Bacillaceae]UGB30386.1 hypothetical protein LPC09_22225 [Metabacillus sp. B2-18]